MSPGKQLQVIGADAVQPQPWRNGGGQTRELLAWPADGEWRVRISRADIAADGPFSPFDEVERWFTVLRGAGVVLNFSTGDRTLRLGDQPLCFDGAAAPGCRLLDGPTQDLNLMLRQGTGVMQTVQTGRAWNADFTMRGLYTTVAGRWTDAQAVRDVDPDTLLWVQDAGPGDWTFLPNGKPDAGSAWWLAFTPKD